MNRYRFKNIPYLAIAYFILAAGLLLYAARLEIVAKDTNRILKTEVQEKDSQITALNYILNEQAAPAIIFLLKQCKAQKFPDCPEVLLSPTEPSFEEQRKEGSNE